MNLTKQTALEALKKVFVSGAVEDIVTAELVKNVQVFGEEVVVDVICPKPALAVKKKLEVDILKSIHEHAHPKAVVKVNITVPESTEKELPQIQGPALPGVQNIIVIASGKGGVGKSTITANLAVALAKMGFKVGLVDADIYGPSMPMMFDVVNEKPGTVTVNGQNKMEPVEAYGVKLLSIGFFAGANQAVVWRGPMASKALNQLIRDAHWGELDFLLLDLPPGTGDIHLSIVQAVPVTGAVVVSTPQPIALSDARKGVAMFNMDAINIPVLGLAENMAFFIPEDAPEKKYYIFGHGGARHLSTELNVPFLGEIPLVQSIREAADVGRPAILQENTPSAKAFEELARRTVEELVQRNHNLPPTEVVRITTMAGCAGASKTKQHV